MARLEALVETGDWEPLLPPSAGTTAAQSPVPVPSHGPTVKTPRVLVNRVTHSDGEVESLRPDCDSCGGFVKWPDPGLRSGSEVWL